MDFQRFLLKSFGAKGLKTTTLYITLLLILTSAMVAFFSYQLNINYPLEGLANKTLILKPGSNAAELVKQLREKGANISPRFVLIYMRIKGYDRKLKPAKINISRHDSVKSLIEKVVNYTPRLVKVTLYEGMDTFEMAETLKRKGIIKSEREFLNFTIYRQPSLEGKLFPDTYLLSEDLPVKEIIKVMTKNFKSKIEPLLSKSSILGPYETLIVASMIQKETYNEKEMPVVASVIYNRLKRKMKLQIDPTVIYAKKLIIGKNLSSPPSKKDLQIDSPYNTYKYPGLPPTPICNPGMAAVRAAVYPAKTDYLYFVSKGDGTHIFAKTLREHIRNIQRLHKR